MGKCGGGHSANGKSVPFVNVWHYISRLEDAGKGSDIYQLLEGTVPDDVIQKGFFRDDPRRDPHPWFVVCRDFPAIGGKGDDI